MAVYSFDGAFRNLNDSISNIGKGFEERRKREEDAKIGGMLTSGDHAGAAQALGARGDFGSSLKVIDLGRQQADGAAFNQGLQGLLGGVQSGQPQASPSLNDLGKSAPQGGGAPGWGGSGQGAQRLGDIGKYNPSGQQPAFAQAQPIGPSGDFSGVFSTVEQQYGLPKGYLERTAHIESRGNPNAKNPNSSAGGLFQFIDGTAKQYGLANRFDPQAATDAAGRLAMDNANILRRGLSREPSAAELYLAHQQGAGGAMKLLSNPNARAADIVGEKAARLNGGDPNMTAGQFAGLWLNKFGGQQSQGGQPTQVAQSGQQGPSTAERAQMAIQRVDMLLNDPDSQLTPEHRQQLQDRRQKYVGMAQAAPEAQPQAAPQLQAQSQADLPAQGAMEAQQAFQIPGTGEVIPAGTRLTQRAINMMKMLGANVPDHKKEPIRQMLKLELEQANPATQLDIEGKRLSNEKSRRDLARGETTANITEYNYAKQQGYTGSFDKFLTDKAQKTTVDMRGESEEAKAIGQAAGKRAGDTMNAAFLGTKQLQRLGQMETLMQRVETGKMAQAKMSLSAWGNALGINDEVLRGMGLDPKTVGDAQAMNAIAGRMVIDMIGAGGFPANNFSDADRQFITGTVPQLANDPRGNKLIMEAARRTAQLDIEKAKTWRQWKNANRSGSFDDFEMIWANQMGSKNHFADLADEASAITGARPGAQQGRGGSTPKVGDMNMGYRFRGGDPGNPASWEKAR